jgi:hypothetical protein
MVWDLLDLRFIVVYLMTLLRSPLLMRVRQSWKLLTAYSVSDSNMVHMLYPHIHHPIWIHGSVMAMESYDLAINQRCVHYRPIGMNSRPHDQEAVI